MICFFQGHFQCFGEKANFDHLDKFSFLDSSCREKYFFAWLILIFGIKSSIPLLWLSSEKWIDCKLMRDKNSSFYTFFNVSVKRQILAQNLPKFAFSKRQILSLFTNLVSHYRQILAVFLCFWADFAMIPTIFFWESYNTSYCLHFLFYGLVSYSSSAPCYRASKIKNFKQPSCKKQKKSKFAYTLKTPQYKLTGPIHLKDKMAILGTPYPCSVSVLIIT